MINDNETVTGTVQPDQGNPWEATESPETSVSPDTTTSGIEPAAPVTPQSQAQSPGLVMDEKMLRTLVRETADAVKPQAPPPQMSMDEFNRVMNVFQATPEVAQKLGLAPEAAQTLNEVLQAVARQAVTMAEYRIRDIESGLRKHYDGQLTPLQQHYQAQQEQQYRSEFLASNKDLVGWEPLLEATYAQLKAEGKRFETKEQAYKEIADRARAVIKKLPNSGNAQNGETAATTTPTNGRRMSTLTGGGQGGAGGGKGAPASTAKSIFG